MTEIQRHASVASAALIRAILLIPGQTLWPYGDSAAALIRVILLIRGQRFASSS